MTSAVLIAPSILACDFAHLADEIGSVEAGGADWIHVDVMDGHFVPNITIGPTIVAAARRSTSLPLDVHLMIEPVDLYLEAFAEAGASIITVHVEATRHLDRTVSAVRDLGVKVGVSLNPATPVAHIAHVLDRIDLVLAMSVNPGFGGQSFIDYIPSKVAEIRRLAGDRPLLIEVDGGITVETIARVVSVGADVLVAGSSVFGKPDRAAAIAALRAAALAC